MMISLDHGGVSEEPHFFVEWLQGAAVVEQTILDAKDRSEAISAAHGQSTRIIAGLTGRKPDGFRLIDSNGREVGVFDLKESPPGRDLEAS
jgi:hypothetical protein